MLFARMFVIGIIVAAPVGAMAVLCMERVLQRGWKTGLLTGAGIASADALYASVASFGLGAVSDALIGAQTEVRLVGGLALVILGVRGAMGYRAARRESGLATGALGRHQVVTYSSALLLTLSNPSTIITFAAIFAAAGLVQAGSVSEGLVAVLGVAAGSFAWWCVLVGIVALAGRTLTDGWRARISAGSSVVVALLGVAAIVSGLSAV